MPGRGLAGTIRPMILRPAAGCDTISCLCRYTWSSGAGVSCGLAGDVEPRLTNQQYPIGAISARQGERAA